MMTTMRQSFLTAKGAEVNTHISVLISWINFSSTECNGVFLYKDLQKEEARDTKRALLLILKCIT